MKPDHVIVKNVGGVFSNVIKTIAWYYHFPNSKIDLFYSNNRDNGSYQLSQVCKVNPKRQLAGLFWDVHLLDIKEDEEILCTMYEPNHHDRSLISFHQTLYINPWDHVQLIESAHEIWKNHFRYSSRLRQKIQVHVEQTFGSIDPSEVLAVFLRYDNHYLADFPDGYLDIQEIEQMMKDSGCKYILPLTQVLPKYQIVLEHFGKRVIQTERARFSSDIDWETRNQMADQDFIEEIDMSIIDTHLASLCGAAMGGASGMLIGALVMNPKLICNTRYFKKLVGVGCR